MDDFYQKMQRLAKDFRLKDLDVNVTVIPNRVYNFDGIEVN